jgi:hypothetical protein
MRYSMTDLWLDNKLVAKHFGTNPEKGRRIRGHTIRSSCGIRYKAAWGNGKFIPHEMTVDMVIALRWIGGDNRKGLWRVEADQYHYDTAIRWLIDNCQIQPPPRVHSIKRRGRTQVAKWGRMPMRVDNG